jgi:RNA polymerase sigma-70 factor (ECF subfamily)
MFSQTSRLDPPDRELLQRAASGDREAFGLIYGRYQDVVYRFGRSMTGCPTAAEDITQEVFVALFRDLARYDAGRASFTTYLYGIVRNLSRERLRRERRFLSLDIFRSPARRFTYVADPGDALDEAELATQVRVALQALPTRYRELIVLCDLHNLSYADAAAVVHISVAAVRSRLHRGRLLLRTRFARMTRAEARESRHPARCTI